MTRKDYHIAIIWTGAIDDPDILNHGNIQAFAHIGTDAVQGVINSLNFDQVDAIICAPGITDEIKRLISVPLTIVNVSYIDILETIKHAELNLGIRDGKIAVMLHESTNIYADRLSYFIHNTVDLYKYNSKDQIWKAVQHIARSGYDLLIGGPTAEAMASEFNVKAIQIVYHKQVLPDALKKTTELLSLMDKERRDYERLKVIIDVIPDGIIETDATGAIKTCNRKTLEMLHLPPDQVLGQNVCQILGDPSWASVYLDHAIQADAIFTYKKNKYFSSRQPILEGGNVIGSVGTLQRASKIQDMETKYRFQQNRGLVATYTFDQIIGESPLMQEIIERAKIYTYCDKTVLLLGETGTGKEIFAQSIHNASQRNRAPFVAVNCAALPETLLESELMGYDEGAFTGARKGGQAGLFEQAHQGTIFLDEISHLSPQLQAKLLRVIQEKVVRRLGSDAVTPVDVRIIAAANENLKDKMAAHTFRSDLYYRLNVLQILLPPLRERREDIPMLMRHFAVQFETNEEILAHCVRNMHSLTAGYDWPGNIRELQSFVDRYMILSGRVSHLDKYFFHEFLGDAQSALSSAIQTVSRNSSPLGAAANGGRGPSFTLCLDSLERMESELIKAVVDHCSGNKSKAALLMNISRNTVHQRLKG